VWVVLANCLAGRGARAFELFQMINPITHAQDKQNIDIYKTEPYVLCGDVYTATGHVGRGGWSWYTGSASWLYRTGVESILGFHKTASRLYLNPCIPPEWDGFELTYKLSNQVVYHITVQNPHHVSTGVISVHVDGSESEDLTIPIAEEDRPVLKFSTAGIEETAHLADIKIVVDSPGDERGKERIKDNEDEPRVEEAEHKSDFQNSGQKEEKGKGKEKEKEKEKDNQPAQAGPNVRVYKVLIVMGDVSTIEKHPDH